MTLTFTSSNTKTEHSYKNCWLIITLVLVKNKFVVMMWRLPFCSLKKIVSLSIEYSKTLLRSILSFSLYWGGCITLRVIYPFSGCSHKCSFQRDLSHPEEEKAKRFIM